jgi:hypothetical protein
MKTASGWHTATTLLADRRFWTILLVCAAALLYLWTLDDGLRAGELLGGDLITHQFAQVEARPSNAPGYPLYTMGGWLWFHSLRELAMLGGVHGGTTATGELLPPNPLPILSSYSTLWALCAVGLLFQLLCQFTSSPGSPQGRLWLAAPLTIFYIVTYFFWYYATTTEQYSSAIAQTLLLVYLYDKWSRRQPGQTADRILLLMAFVSGVSLAHMLTVAFIVPPLVAVILWQQPALLRRPWLILGAILAAALPLLSYFYVYLRGAGHPEWWGAGLLGHHPPVSGIQLVLPLRQLVPGHSPALPALAHRQRYSARPTGRSAGAKTLAQAGGGRVAGVAGRLALCQLIAAHR